MWVLGCLCFPFTRPYNAHKLQARSKPCVFIDYALSQKRYKCYNLDSNKIFISRHVIFDGQQFPFRSQISGAISDCADPPNSANWLGVLPVITPNPPTPILTNSATADPQPPPSPTAPLRISGPSSSGADPAPVRTSSSRLLEKSGPAHIAADPPSFLTYSRRPKTKPGPSMVAAAQTRIHQHKPLTSVITFEFSGLIGTMRVLEFN